MAENSAAAEPWPLCPSARPEMDGAVIFGVVGGTPAAPRLAYLTAPVPVTPDILAAAHPATPAEVYRAAAPCAAAACRHFDGSACQLAQRTVRLLPMVVTALPPCRIRASCRWWKQEGRAACLRCPQVVTDDFAPTDLQREAAGLEPE